MTRSGFTSYGFANHDSLQIRIITPDEVKIYRF